MYSDQQMQELLSVGIALAVMIIISIVVFSIFKALAFHQAKSLIKKWKQYEEEEKAEKFENRKRR